MRKSEVLAAEAVSCLNKALCHLKDIWEEIGIPEEQRLERTNVVKTHIRGLLDMMIAEEESLRKRLMTSIDTCRKELNKVCLELQLPPYQEERGNTMLQQEKDIRTCLEVMLKQKGQRMQTLKTLIEQDQDLCDILCLEPFSISASAVPSLEQLESFRQHIAQLTAEKEQRHSKFVELKKQIILCMDDLDQLPETSFEKDIVCEDEEAFCLSKDNIDSLKVLLHQLESRKAENERSCGSYREKIQQLWDRLHISQEDRDAIAEHMTMSKKRNMEALQAEVKRLEELKLRNIQDLTKAIREEITVFWDKCFYSTDQRQAFLPYYDDNFSEELLNLHESEIQRLKQHYEEHKELFEGVHKWEESWKLFLELEKKATDPSRFTNRGGNLLKEEKQRSDLLKGLPKLEKKLKAQIEQWEQEQGREFLVQGQKFMQFISEQWELYHLEKEREKQERQMKKSKQTEEDMLYGTAVRSPTKRRFLGSMTPCKARKLNATSSTSTGTSNSTMRSVFGGTVCHSPVSRPPISASKGNSLKTPGRGKPPHQGLAERNKENVCHLTCGTGGVLKTPASPQRNFSINSVASTYSEFAEIVNVESIQSRETSPRPQSQSTHQRS
ncbi:protein regulator of cytokinesis 1b isoform X3 [Pangasianodon hypophthalmus]|uniref:protein regulator of cytokinesis 1b isoform X3 n=1 Tax=Pangasianodon hypophthalmus TaxID=310915 RepID=UPI0023079714|nr:protein regulator of cytokinesis 1b isoform X3 [Pangasianodon hypophthalmus]